MSISCTIYINCNKVWLLLQNKNTWYYKKIEVTYFFKNIAQLITWERNENFESSIWLTFSLLSGYVCFMEFSNFWNEVSVTHTYFQTQTIHTMLQKYCSVERVKDC